MMKRMNILKGACDRQPHTSRFKVLGLVRVMQLIS